MVFRDEDDGVGLSFPLIVHRLDFVRKVATCV